jgi:hypothetical protein
MIIQNYKNILVSSAFLLCGQSLTANSESIGAKVFGNVQTGVSYSSGSIDGTKISSPYGKIAGHVALDFDDSPIGFQFDLDGNATSLKFIRPSLPIEGHASDISAIGHITLTTNDYLKLGVYGGYENANVTLTKITDPTLNVLNYLNVSKASGSLDFISIGGEALYAYSPSSWVQMRAGYIHPKSWSLSLTDATTNLEQSVGQNIENANGMQIGFGVREGLSNNWSVRGDTNFTTLFPDNGYYLSLLDVQLTGQYSFDAVPLAATAAVGYDQTFTNGNSSGSWTAKTGLSLSFGAPSLTAKGRLFHGASALGSSN